MKIVIPDDYQDMVDQLPCYSLIKHHDVARYRTPARDLDEFVERLKDADVVVSIRERVEFSRALLERLPKLKLIALVGRNSHMLDFDAAPTRHSGLDRRQQLAGRAGRIDPGADRRLAPQRGAGGRADAGGQVAVHAVASHSRLDPWHSSFSVHIGSLVAEGGKELGMKVLVWPQENRWRRRRPRATRPPRARPSCSSTPTCSRCTCG